jgi:ArsR family transcriptional regulator
MSLRRAAAFRPVALAAVEVDAVTTIFRALSDPTRLRILMALASGEVCVHDLCVAVGMSQPAVSHQLRLLRVVRLVRGRRVGREVFYAIDDEHVMELVAQARSHVGHLPRGRSAR